MFLEKALAPVFLDCFSFFRREIQDSSSEPAVPEHVYRIQIKSPEAGRRCFSFSPDLGAHSDQ